MKPVTDTFGIFSSETENLIIIRRMVITIKKSNVFIEAARIIQQSYTNSTPGRTYGLCTFFV